MTDSRASRILRLVSFFWLAAACLSALVFVRDRQRRTAADEFAARFDLAGRRPLNAQAIEYAPSADFAYEAAGDAAFQDVLAPQRLEQLDAAQRRMWLKAAERFDDELKGASALLADAIALRPGWSRHRGVLGQVQFMRARRDVRLGEKHELWVEPLLSAVDAAPGKESFAIFAAAAAMEAWPFLDRKDRIRVQPLMRGALDDPRFVRIAYADLTAMIGRDRVVRWLPDAPSVIRAALEIESGRGNVEEAFGLYRRWEVAEWRSRADDLKAIEERLARSDAASARRLAHQWLRQHAVGDYDSPEGRRQLSRLLQIWPPDPGRWGRDPRTAVVEFLLNARSADADPAALQRTVAMLSGVPDVVHARVALSSGDSYRARRLAETSDTAGSFEWTRYYVELALRELGANREDGARAALAHISPAAGGECDVAMLRRLLRREAPDLNAERAFWSGRRLPLCIAPEAVRLRIWFDVPDRAIIAYGFDGGRSATISAAAGRNAVTIPLATYGRHIFSLQKVAGPDPVPVAAVLE